MQPIIKVENLGKKYLIHHQQKQRYIALRDEITQGIKRLGHKLIHPFSKNPIDNSEEEFWALRDINFEIQQGDKVGIIGRNGAGKSTLLKLLSRITEPTTGRITLRGRVASLLEVGTGFHPELTGRENIFLNGAILGMSKAEIKRKFDEIVAFAEVEKFLDTPVKHYSSGMYVRLAFAVAAHLEPEILIVDEVLAVGDTEFQKKCLGKMNDIGKEGSTILFVSHNMAVITTLCKKAIWIHQGQIHSEGNTENIIKEYLMYNAEHSGEIFFNKNDSEQRFSFKKAFLLNLAGNVSSIFDVREPIKFCLEYEVKQNIRGLAVGFKITNISGISVFTVDRSLSSLPELTIGNYFVEVEIPALFLAPNHYNITICAHIPNSEILSLYQSVLDFEVEETGSKMAQYKGADFGVIIVDFEWKEMSLHN